jgi:hypothetical protein
MLTLILTHSDHIVTAMFGLIFLALLIARPQVSCYRRRRWERQSSLTDRRG